MDYAALGVLAIGASFATSQPQELEHRAVEGRTLRTIIVVESQSDLLALSFTVDGEPMEDEDETPTSTTRSEQLIVIEDCILGVESGAAVALQRTFVTLAGSMSTDGNVFESEEHDLVSDLVDEELRLTRAAGDSDWTFAEGERSRALSKTPAHSPQDLSCAELLPDGAVDEDDQWEIPVQWLFDLEAPCGDLGLHPEEGGAEDWVEGELGQPTSSGIITATYRGMREVDDLQLAVIELEIDARTQAEFGMEDPDGGSIQGTQERILDGAGTVLWNVAGGHLQRLKIELKEEASSTQTWEELEEGERFELEATDSETGRVTIDVNVRVTD